MSRAKVIEARLEELTKRLFDTLYWNVSLGRIEESGLLLRLIRHARPELSSAECAQELAQAMEIVDRDASLTGQGEDAKRRLRALFRSTA